MNSTEVSIHSLPVSVFYDSSTNTATVSFRVTQNATGDGTIDPAHIKVSFSGKDSYGNAMNSSANQYDGMAQVF